MEPDAIAAARTLPDAPPLPAPHAAALLDTGAVRRGQAPLLTFYDDATGERTELSWATFENWVAKTANLLVDELEVRRGDRVATVLGSSWTTAVVTVACWRVGAALVPVDADGPLAEVRALLAAAAPRVVFCREDLLDDLPDLVPDTAAEVVAVGTGMAGRATTDVGSALPYAEEVLAFGDHVDAPAPSAADTALLVWSGEAGGLARLSHEAVVAGAAAVAAWGLRDRDRVLLSRPLQAVDGLVTGLAAVLAARGSLVLTRAMPAEALMGRVDDERVTVAVPRAAALEALLASPEQPAPEGFRGFLAAAGVPDALLRAAWEAGWQVGVGHGLAEAGCASSLVPADVDAATRAWLRDAAAPTVGCATAFAQVGVDTAGPYGSVGPLRVRGPVLASGYEARPDLDAAFADGWFATGQRGFLAVGPDGREYAFLSGRA